MENKRIVFLGTPSISAYVLEGLIKAGFNIVLVVTKEDKVRKRGRELEPSEVAKVAAEYNIPVHKPHKLNLDYQPLVDADPDLLLTFAYGQIIKEDILHLSKYKPLNLHASLLPKYRGAAPIQYALRNGDKKTGVSLMEMIKEMDAGEVYAVEELAIDDEDNYTSLSEKVAKTALKLAIEKLPLYFENKLSPVKQDPAFVSFCPTIKKEEEHLNLNQSCISFINQVRSLSFTPGGYLLFNDEMLKIYKASFVSNKVTSSVGTILRAHKGDLHLQLEDGIVNLDLLQRPGKKILNTSDFNNGNHLEGVILR